MISIRLASYLKRLDTLIDGKANIPGLATICIERAGGKARRWQELVPVFWSQSPRLRSARDQTQLCFLLSAFLAAHAEEPRLVLGRELASPARRALYFPWVECRGEIVSTGTNPHSRFEPLYEMTWRDEDVEGARRGGLVPEWLPTRGD